MPLVLAGATSGSTTIQATDAVTQTLTLPNATGTLAFNGPAFRAYQSTAQSALTANIDTKILLQTTNFDTNNNFASSRFTPTVAGYYQINASMQINGSTTIAYVSLYKNGSAYKYGSLVATTTNNPISTVSEIVYLNGSTDYIEMYGTSGTSQAPSANSTLTSMSGCLIRGA